MPRRMFYHIAVFVDFAAGKIVPALKHPAFVLSVSTVIIFLLSAYKTQAQSNLTTKTIALDSTSVRVDSLSLIPGTVRIFDSKGKKIDSSKFSIDYAKGTINISAELLKNNDSLKIIYRYFPLDLSAEHYHKKISGSQSTSDSVTAFYYVPKAKSRVDPLNMEGFQKSGSISRAVSAGNSQNLSVASDMNLQLSGKITPALQLTAVITDNNIPIQPDGNTQELQDFDKVFIRLDHKNGSLTAGDFVLKKPDSYFLNYNKKSQGAMAETGFKTGRNKAGIIAYAALALSRGNYNRYKFNGIEGNQGPYKLQGANFERYIVILSGSEKVYMDGKLLKRGESNDYVINYNTAEITFMPRILVTKDKRFEVEFEYSVQYYTRALVAGGFSYHTERFKVSTNIFSEGDLKNQPIDKALTNKEKAIMSSAGDNLDQALISSVDSTAFFPGRPMYKMIDSLGYDSVFVYSTNPDSAFYQITFSYVGAGKGDYVMQKSSANGRVFRWIAPVGGVSQGDYAPVRLLVTPKKQQMITSSFDYRLGKNTDISAEVAVSNKDINTFSSLDAGDNTGAAAKFSASNKSKISGGKNPWLLNTRAEFQFVQKNFSAVERYRPVEFDRDWNGLPSAVSADEYLGKALVTLSKKRLGFFRYSFDSYNKGANYAGYKNGFAMMAASKGWQLSGNVNNTQTSQNQISTRFLRHNAVLKKSFGKLNTGIRENAEYNTFTLKDGNILLPASFDFQETGVFISTADSSKTLLKMEYKHRTDSRSDSTILKRASTADDFIVEAGLMKNPKNNLRFTGSYRVLKVNDTALAISHPDESLRGRIEHRLILYKGALRATTFYETNSGLEFKKEYSYIEVAPGQGVYSWTDYNGNGIKELDEFEIAAFQDQANYIRILIPSTEYVKTYGNRFSTNIMITPSIIWRKSGNKFFKTMALFSDNLTFRSRIKTGNKDLAIALNPFNLNISDPQTVYISSFFRNTLFFNRNNPVFGIDWTFNYNKNKALMLNGYEGRSLQQNKLRLRWNITRSYLIELEDNMGNKAAFSEFFDTRNFNINFMGVKSKFTYQPGRTFRTSITYTYQEKYNGYPLPDSQRAFNNALTLGAKINNPQKGNLTALFSLIDWKYSGQEGNQLAFEMLEGYRKGLNLQWNISYNRTIMKNLQLTIVYNGRKPVSSKTIHTGTIQLRAFF